MEENKESILEKLVDFAKGLVSKPWIHSSTEQDYLSPDERRRFYEIMNKYH